MPYISYKLGDLRKHRTVAEHLYLGVGESYVAERIITDLFVQIAFGYDLLLLFGFIYLNQVLSGFVDIYLVYVIYVRYRIVIRHF